MEGVQVVVPANAEEMKQRFDAHVLEQGIRRLPLFSRNGGPPLSTASRPGRPKLRSGVVSTLGLSPRVRTATYALGTDVHVVQSALEDTDVKQTSWPNKPKVPPIDPATERTEQTALAAISAPTIVRELQSFVEGELAALGRRARLGEGEVDEPRLAVFRQAFERFIDHFPTYRFLLARIKAEYDSAVSVYASQAVQVPPLVTKLSTINAEHDNHNKALVSEHSSMRSSLTAEIKQLRARIASLEQQQARDQETIAQLDKELGIAKDNVRDGFEKRKALVDKLKIIEETVFDKTLEYAEEKKKYEARKEQLATVQTDLQLVIAENQKLKRKMDSMVPEKDLEMMHNTSTRLASELAALKESHEALTKAHDRVTDEVQDLRAFKTNLEQTNNSLSTEVAFLKRQKTELQMRVETPTGSQTGSKSGTASDATDMGDILRLIPTAKQDTLQSMSQQELFAFLLEHIKTQRDEYDELRSSLPSEALIHHEEVAGPQVRQFQGRGTGTDVPPYLRFHGKIRNRKLSKRDTELIVRDVWQQRTKQDQQRAGDKARAHRENELEGFFFLYLKKRFGLQATVAEWGYNIIHSLERYSYDSDLDVFRRVLLGQCVENVYHDQLRILERLKKAFRKRDLLNEGKAKGTLLKRDIMDVVARFFPAKTNANLDTLREALNFDQPGLVVQYDKLFAEDRDFSQGRFLETIRHQLMTERDEFLREFEEGIRVTASLRENVNRITVADASRVFELVDPSKPKKEVDNLLALIYDVQPASRLIPQLSLAAGEFCDILGKQVVHRSGWQRNKLENMRSRPT